MKIYKEVKETHHTGPCSENSIQHRQVEKNSRQDIPKKYSTGNLKVFPTSPLDSLLKILLREGRVGKG